MEKTIKRTASSMTYKRVLNVWKIIFDKTVKLFTTVFSSSVSARRYGGSTQVFYFGLKGV